jgi:hypothetical protein
MARPKHAPSHDAPPCIPPQPCLAPCPTCGQGQVLVRTYDMRTHVYRDLPAPLTPLLGEAYQCTAGAHTPLGTPAGTRDQAA